MVDELDQDCWLPFMSTHMHMFVEVCVAALDCARLDLASECISALNHRFPRSNRILRLQAMHQEAAEQWVYPGLYISFRGFFRPISTLANLSAGEVDPHAILHFSAYKKKYDLPRMDHPLLTSLSSIRAILFRPYILRRLSYLHMTLFLIRSHPATSLHFPSLVPSSSMTSLTELPNSCWCLLRSHTLHENKLNADNYHFILLHRIPLDSLLRTGSSLPTQRSNTLRWTITAVRNWIGPV